MNIDCACHVYEYVQGQPWTMNTINRMNDVIFYTSQQHRHRQIHQCRWTILQPSCCIENWLNRYNQFTFTRFRYCAFQPNSILSNLSFGECGSWIERKTMAGSREANNHITGEKKKKEVRNPQYFSSRGFIPQLRLHSTHVE